MSEENKPTYDEVREAYEQQQQEINRLRAILGLIDREVSRGVSFAQLLVARDTLAQQNNQLIARLNALSSKVEGLQASATKEPSASFESAKPAKKKASNE